MNFQYYSPKTIRQINTELTARLNEKGTKARPAIHGFVEKGGVFHLTTQTVLMGITRTTRLRASMEKVKDVTVIHGYVSEGAQPQQVYVVMAALGFVGLLLALGGQVVLGLIVGGVSLVAYVPLVGDYRNSKYLLKELKRASDAKDKPPASLAAPTAKSAPRSKATATTPAVKPPRAATPARPRSTGTGTAKTGSAAPR